jgi:hypothetical protein
MHITTLITALLAASACDAVQTKPAVRFRAAADLQQLNETSASGGREKAGTVAREGTGPAVANPKTASTAQAAEAASPAGGNTLAPLPGSAAASAGSLKALPGVAATAGGSLLPLPNVGSAVCYPGSSS